MKTKKLLPEEKNRFVKETNFLLIEGDPDHADLIIDILKEKHKGQVVLKKDGEAAIDYIQEINSGGEDVIRSSIDLVILDLNIPKVDGMDILKFLKKNSKLCSIPVVVFSLNSDQKTIDDAHNNGAVSYITKPVFYEDFIEKLETLKKYIWYYKFNLAIDGSLAERSYKNCEFLEIIRR